ncbi:MAG: response regulator [Lachnospiraceae bacterium]|nr:response regulator [Lachnospiraceae bacterium]
MIFQTIARTIDPRDGQTSVGRISENIRDLSRQQSDTQHVVIVDDDELNLLMAEDILSGQNIEVTCLSSGNELLEYVGSNTPDLILLDICMPVMDGFETLKELKKIMADSEEIPVIFLSAAEEDESETRGLRLGAVDFIKKPFEPDVLLLRVRRTIELARLQKDLASEIDRKSRENEALSLHVVQTLAEAIDAKDTYTNGHSTRVAQYSREIARRYGYSKKAQEDIYMMGLLHDVGKIGVPDEIINKPARLTDEEFELIKAHPVIGCNILQKIEEMPKLQTGAHWHHERYDGKGYPDGLAGEDIPEEARIIAVADAYDAMTSRRSYRDILPQEVVKGEIEKGRGLQFDPTFADIMLEIIADDITYGLKES